MHCDTRGGTTRAYKEYKVAEEPCLRLGPLPQWSLRPGLGGRAFIEGKPQGVGGKKKSCFREKGLWEVSVRRAQTTGGLGGCDAWHCWHLF